MARKVKSARRAIGREAGVEVSQVEGAIRGTRGQYHPELSLLKLKLVVEKTMQIVGKRELKVYRFEEGKPETVSAIEAILRRYRRSEES